MCEILCELLEALLTTRCGRSALCSHTRQRLDEVPTAKLQEDLGEETSWGGGTVVWVHVRLASPSVGNVVPYIHT